MWYGRLWLCWRFLEIWDSSASGGTRRGDDSVGACVAATAGDDDGEGSGRPRSSLSESDSSQKSSGASSTPR